MKESSLYDLLDTVFVVNGEMIKDNGEDGYAYSINENCGLISVFDGCGGIGSRRYDNFGNKTGAYLASHITADLFLDEFNMFFQNNEQLTANTFSKFCETIKNKLTVILSNLDKESKKTLIKGSLSKNFPTTMSAILFNHSKDNIFAYFTWAGDSRGFLLLPTGLMQITKDDIYGGEDALSNISSDGNLSNYISAEGNFYYNKKIIKCPKKAVLITATDGCFGYFSSPMEFEYMILDTLKKSSSVKEWRKLLNQQFLEYAGDDFTMVVSVLGFGSFKKLKRYFLKRHTQLYKKYIKNLKEASKNDLYDMWNDYKKVYYRRYTISK